MYGDNAHEIRRSRSLRGTRVLFLVAALGVNLTITSTGMAQPAFEVASLKLNKDGRGESGLQYTPGRLTATNLPLKALLKEAFQVKGFQILGAPGWAGTARYDVNAKAETGASMDDVRAMLRDLLIRRLHLVIRRDMEDLPVYVLEAAKTGARLGEKIEFGPSANRTLLTGRGSLKGSASLPELADYLSGQLQRVVVDKTGIAGVYSFDIRYAPDDVVGENPGRTDVAPAPSLFESLRQLGLRLEARKEMVPVYRIDRVEKEPAEN